MSSLPPPPIVALVVPCYNEEACIDEMVATLRALQRQMIADGRLAADSFLYLIDDGSCDQTWPKITAAHAADTAVRGLRLSRNFGHQAALLAGLTRVASSCDAAISLDADLQQDPQAIPAFVEAYQGGAEVVIGVRADRHADGWFKRSTARAFYWLMNAMGVQLVPDHADFRLLGRRALVALSEYKESNIFLRALCLRLGFQQARVLFSVRERQRGQSKYTLRKMLRLALYGITSSSTVPLRLVAMTGFCTFLFSALMGIYVLYTALFTANAVPGWASTTLPIYFIGGIQLLCLGVVGEYVGQIMNEVRNRPRFHGDDELF